MANRWLTPDSPPADFVCRRLFIPNNVDWIAIVSGALFPLIKDYNFEPYGAATPEETADVFSTMFDEYSLNGACRMIGEIITYAGTTSPNSSWLPCDGASLLRIDYPDLFAVIGTTYGAADSSHFNIPDFQGRSGMGVGAGTGLSPRAIGSSLGEESHTLNTSELASHTHVDTGHFHSEGNAIPAVGAAIVGVPIPSAVPSVGVTGTASANLANTGGDSSHNTIHPVIVVNYLIVALP